MDLSTLRFLHRYNVWANGRLFDAVAEGPDEVRTSAIRDIVAHITSAEWIWMERLSGVNPSDVPDWVDEEGLPSLRNLLGDVEEQREAFLTGLDISDVTREVEYRFLSGKAGKAPVWRLLTHIFNHSTYHRGQLARALREAGITPPATDMIFFEPEE